MLSAPALNARAGRVVSWLQGLTKGSAPVRPEVVDGWVSLLAPSVARLRREAFAVGLLGHQAGDLARMTAALYESELLPEDADQAPGRLLRIVWTDSEPELEEHTPHDSPWHWSTAHPDPVPPLMAKATGLQAERAVLTREDQEITKEAGRLERQVSQLQQEVLVLSSAAQDARAAERQAAKALQAEEAQLTSALQRHGEVRMRLPHALQTDKPSSHLQSLQAAVQAPFHPQTLDELAREGQTVEQAQERVAQAHAHWEAAEASAGAAKSRLTDHEQQLRKVRGALTAANQRRQQLRDRADVLSRTRLSLAQQMDHAAEARRSTLADDLAARLHGDSTGRLRLRWPHAGLGADTISLLAPGSLSPDTSTRQLAEDVLTQRADVLLVGARLSTSPAAARVQALLRMLRSCPRIALVFHDHQKDAIEVRLAARNAWAEALRVHSKRILAVALPGELMSQAPHTDGAPLRAGRREIAALVEALRAGPLVARAACISNAIRSTAKRVDSELRRQQRGHEAQLKLLEAQRIVDIPAFIAERDADIDRHVEPVAHRAREAVRRSVVDHLAQLRTDLTSELRSATDTESLELICEQLPSRLIQAMQDGQQLARRAAIQAEERAIQELIDAALTSLSERVRLSSMATLPPGQEPSLAEEEDEAQQAILDRLRTSLQEEPTATSTGSAALAGGAIGAALLGPMGALIGAGAGVLVSKVSGGLGKRCQSIVEQLDQTIRELELEAVRQATARLDDCELRIGARVDALLPKTLARYVNWWTKQRAELTRQHDRLQPGWLQLEQVRDRLLASAAEVVQAIARDRSPGVMLPTIHDEPQPTSPEAS